MARKREYLPIGKKEKFNTYHEWYDRLRVESYILNGGGRRPSFDTVIWTKNRIVGEIIWIEGGEKGMVYNKATGEETLALIPQTKKQLRTLQKRFSNYQQQRVNEGYQRPKEMPDEMLKERLELEARLDVFNEELKELKRREASIQVEEDKEHAHLLLAYGVASGGSLYNGILVELDGQKVSLNSNNILIIDDPLSPYDGVLVADYREYISKPWRKATEKLRNKKAELSRKLISRGQYDDRFNLEWGEMQKQLIDENGWSDLFAIKLAGKPSIPKVPDHLKNYKKRA